MALQGWDRSQVALAWATTVHKAQGGEFPAVVVVLHQDMAREWARGEGWGGRGAGHAVHCMPQATQLHTCLILFCGTLLCPHCYEPPAGMLLLSVYAFVRACPQHKQASRPHPNDHPAIHTPTAPPGSLLQRQLLYTAVTRARHLLIVVSTRSALVTASSHASVQTRNSLLQPRLTALLQARGLPAPPPVAAVAAPTKTRRSLTPSTRKTALVDVQANTPTAPAAAVEASAAASGSAVAAAEPLPSWPPHEFGGPTRKKASSPRATKKTKALAAAAGETGGAVAMEAAVGEQHGGTAAASKQQSRAAPASEHGQELGAELVMDAPAAAAPSLPQLSEVAEEAASLAQAPSGASPSASSPKPRATSRARRALPPLPQPPTTTSTTCIESETQVAPDAVAAAAPGRAGDGRAGDDRATATLAPAGAAASTPDTPRAVVADAAGPKRRSFYGR